MAADTHLSTVLFILVVFISLAYGRYHEVAFTESPQYSVALPGDSVYFSCRTSLPQALENITWLHNGQPLPWKKSANNGHLTFKVSMDPQVYKDQEGTYQCVGGAQGSQFQLASLEAELNIAKLEDFRANLKDQVVEVFEGNDIVIPCQVPKSIPPAFVQFAKNEELLVDEMDNARILNGDTLLLTNVTLEQSGNYTCIASNHITNERKMSPNVVTLNVKSLEGHRNEKSRLIHRPRDNYEVKLGEDVYIPCTASGVPKPEIVWTRMNSPGSNSSLVIENGVLAIDKAKQSQTGHYMCAVFNGARRFVRRTSVTVIVPPEFVTKADNFVAADEEGTLTLPCQASGSPPPFIEWRINGMPIQEPAAVNRITGDLVIPNANAVDHTGFYQCFAQNKAGQIVAKSFVQVGEDIISDDQEDYDEALEESDVQDFSGFVVTSPTKPNVTQVSAESVVVQWDLQEPEIADKPLVPVKFFKIQFREFFRKERSPWHTLDEIIGPEVSAFEILGLHFDRKYRFRVVVVYENNDSRSGPLSRKFRMNSISSSLSPRPKPPSKSPTIIGILPLGPTSLRIGWVLNEDAVDIEGYFIFHKPSISDEKFQKITILGATSHAFILQALIPGTDYDIKIQAFNLAGASPFSNVTTQATAELPPVKAPEVSEAEIIESAEEPKAENNDIIKYLTLGGGLAGCLILSIILCTVFSFCQRRKSLHKSCNGHAMTDIQDKYNDTALQISNHQSFSNLEANSNAVGSRSNQSFLSTTKDLVGSSHFEMTLLPDPHHGNNNKNHSISDSMFSSGHNSADMNSLGHEEYNDEPSKSWRRSRRSEDGFI